MSKKLTERNTKKELLEGYEALCKELEAKAETQLNPAQVVHQKEKEEVSKVVEEVETLDLYTTLNNIEDQIADLNTHLDKVREIKRAKELEQQELDELFGIKANAYSLVALINNQTQKEEEHKAKLEADRQEFEAEKKAYEEQKKLDKEEADKLKKRDKEEWEYDFAKKQKVENDKLLDELKAKEKAFNDEQEAKEKDFANRLADLEEREKHLAEKDEEILALLTKLETLEAEVVEKTKKKLEESNNYAIKFVKQDLEQKNALIKTELEYLKKDLENEKAKNLSLESKLDEAYKEMKALATTTVEAGANKDTVSKLESILKQGTSK